MPVGQQPAPIEIWLEWAKEPEERKPRPVSGSVVLSVEIGLKTQMSEFAIAQDCNIEAGFAQSADNREVTSFIGQESEHRHAHEAGLKTIFSCESASAA